MQLSSGQVTQTLQEIPDGKAGIITTLKIMRGIVRQSKKALPIRETALKIVGNLAGKDWSGEATLIHNWVRDNIRFVRDITDVETLHDAERVLQYGQGDCDDKSILFASLLEAIGHPTRFVAIGFQPETYSHVYSETLLGRAWVPSDTSEMRPFGWAASDPVAKLIIYN